MRLYTGGALPSVWYVYVPNNIFIIKIYSSDPVCLPNPSLSPITSSHSWMPTTLFPKRNINSLSLISIYIIISKEKYFLLYNTKCMHIFPSRYFTPIPSHGLTPVWKDTTPNSNVGFYILGSGVLHSQRSGSEQLQRWDCLCVGLLCWKEVRVWTTVLTSKNSIQNVLKKKKNQQNKQKIPSRLKAPTTEACHLLEEKDRFQEVPGFTNTARNIIWPSRSLNIMSERRSKKFT